MTTFILPADYYPDAALAAVRERFAARAVVTFGTRGIDVEVCITTSDGPKFLP